MDRIDKYEIIEEIGRGGMGIVYKGIHPFLNKYVAIKVLPEHFVNEKEFVDRFTNEAKTIMNLKHPNIVRLYDAGIYKNNYYIVMDYIEGKTIKEILKTEKIFPINLAIEIIIQLCKALSYTHSMGIIHRDIKPSNIIIENKTNQPYLCDFGIAKAAYGTQLTLTGISVGTPEYMSPEQCKSESVDHRTDIYSLGVTFYEMLTGRVPFEGDTPIGVAYKHVNELPPKPRTFNPQISPYLEKIVLKMLAKNVNDRYSSMDEVLEDLINFKEGNFEKIKAAKYEVNKSILIINTNPQNTKVYIDGEYIGTTPIYNLELNFGDYNFVFVAPNFKDFPKRIKINEKIKEIFVDLEKEEIEIKKEKPVSVKPSEKKKLNFIYPLIAIVGILLILFFGRSLIFKKPVEAKFGYLSIITEPQGAEVHLNEDNLGVTPINNLKKDVGKYKIEILLNGYENVIEEIELKENENKTLKYSLKKMPTKVNLNVNSNPSDAIVYLNDKEIGKTPLKNIQLDTGNYKLKISKSGYEDYITNFEIKDGDKDKNIEVNLKRIEVEYGKIYISSEPTGADIYIGNTYYGKTPKTIELPVGSYSLSLQKTDYETYRTNITISKNITKEINAKLNKKEFRAFITIYSSPSEADVYINNTYIGKSPIINYTVYQSTLKILVKKEKFMDYMVDEKVSNGEEKTIYVELAPIP